MPESKENNHKGTIGIRRLLDLTNARDHAILRSIGSFRLLTTKQICDLHFASHASYASAIRACTRVLARLEQHRLLRRLARHVGGLGGGSGSFIWALDVAGDRLLRTLDGHGDQPRRHPFEPSAAFLDHTLAVSEAGVSLVLAARTGRFELVSIDAEPATWRTFPGGVLKPDLAAVTATADYEDHWFIEVDRGTESIPTLLKKCHVYEQYRLSGTEQEHAGVFPQVLWLLPSAGRSEVLRAAIDADSSFDGRLFSTTTADQLVAFVAGTATQEGVA